MNETGVSGRGVRSSSWLPVSPSSNGLALPCQPAPSRLLSCDHRIHGLGNNVQPAHLWSTGFHPWAHVWRGTLSNYHWPLGFGHHTTPSALPYGWPWGKALASQGDWETKDAGIRDLSCDSCYVTHWLHGLSHKSPPPDSWWYPWWRVWRSLVRGKGKCLACPSM